MSEIPAHIRAQARILEKEGKSVEEIAFMLRLSATAVKDILSAEEKTSSTSKHTQPRPDARR